MAVVAQPARFVAAAKAMPVATAVPVPKAAHEAARLTEGLPDPASIDMQKQAYLRQLEEQENMALAMLEQRRREQLDLVKNQGEAQKKAYNLQVDQEVQKHDLALSQQQGEHMMVLNQQYSSQRGVLEQQANQIVLEYQHKKAHEDMLMHQYQLQREMHDSMQKYEADLNSIHSSVRTPMVALSPARALAVPAAPCHLPPTISYVPPVGHQ